MPKQGQRLRRRRKPELTPSHCSERSERKDLGYNPFQGKRVRQNSKRRGKARRAAFDLTSGRAERQRARDLRQRLLSTMSLDEALLIAASRVTTTAALKRPSPRLGTQKTTTNLSLFPLFLGAKPQGFGCQAPNAHFGLCMTNADNEREQRFCSRAALPKGRNHLTIKT